MSWQQVQLGDIFEIARGGSPRPIDQYITDDPNGLNWISIKDASNSSKYIYKTEKKIKPEGLHKTRLVHPDDFLLTNSMSFGRPYIMKTTGCIHDGWLVLSADKSKVDTDYFYHLLGSDFIYRKFVGLAAGAVVKNLNTDLVKSVTVPLPPINEQRRISSILDKANELRQKRQQAIEKLDQLLQATFIDMFGDPVSNPNNFEQIELDNFILVGPQNGLYKPSNMYGQGIPIVRIDGFKSGDIIDNKEFKRLSLEESDIEKYKLNKFDLVINRVNSPEYIGKTALIRNLEESTVFESNMMRFAVDPSKLDPYYLLFFLKQQFVLNQIANKRKDAVNQSSINQQDVKSLIINVPSIESQLTFSNFFQKIEKNRNLFKQQSLNFDNLFKALQNQAFSGNL